MKIHAIALFLLAAPWADFPQGPNAIGGPFHDFPGRASLPTADYADSVILPVFDFSPELEGSINTSLAGYSFTRATSATTVTRSGSVYTVSTVASGTPRYTDHPTMGAGYWAEPNGTNLVLYSSDFSNAAWTKSALSVDGNSVTAPDGASCTTCDLVADSGSVNAYVIQTPAGMAVNDPVSTFYKAGAFGFVTLRRSGSADYVIFNASTGAVVTTVGSVTATAGVNYGNGWFRFSVTNPSSGGGGPNYYIYACDTGTSLTSTTGDGVTVSGYIWGAQVHDASVVANGANIVDSHIPTTSAAASRNSDQLIYASLITAQPGSAVVNYTYGNIESTRLLRLGSGNSDNITLGHVTGFRSNTTGTASSVSVWSITGSGALTNFQRYVSSVSWAADNVQHHVDNALIGTDTDTGGAVPSYSAHAYIGFNGSNPGGVIHRVRLYDVPGITQ